MKGYKAFSDDNGNLMCRDMVYEVGQAYEMDGEPVLCERGYHFCQKLADCYNYYSANSRVCEIEADGTIITGDGGKSVANRITVVRELSRSEILDAANTGRDCTGICNTGHDNTGNYNVGNYNTGGWNTGDCNVGYYNTGGWNTGASNVGGWNVGYYNTGGWNVGGWNTGRYNTGGWNTGDWNVTNHSAGVLCTREPECLIFDRPSGMTLRDWRNSDAAYLMQRINIDVNRWISSDDMTDAEKQGHPEHETTGGYLRVGTGEPDFSGWWTTLTDRQRDVIKAIPNFDSDKWKLITGIEV